MQDLLTVDNHSFCPGLLTKGPILDAGSRGLRLSKWFAERGHRVVALDAGEDESAEGVTFYKMALVGAKHAGSFVKLIRTDDLEARYIGPADAQGDRVPAVSLPFITNMMGVDKWDLVKLNIEGSEYDILEELDRPLARQIVFSFHEHTERARGREACDKIIAKLSEWYDVHNQVWEQRYGCRENYWDCLLTERGI
jgi:FkbM family methyltransferase